MHRRRRGLDEAKCLDSGIIGGRLVQATSHQRQPRVGQLGPHSRKHLIEQEAQAIAVGLVGEARDEDRALLVRRRASLVRSPRRQPRWARSRRCACGHSSRAAACRPR